MVDSHEKYILYELGFLIRKLRIDKNITQSQVAYELKTSTRHYQRIESGEVNTSFLKLLKIASIFEVPIEKIICK